MALHDRDLELARRCAAGDEDAWERFVREYRAVLYSAAAGLDPSGGARELADALFADLYGIRSAGDAGPDSLLRYFQGRSSLATWLRAVLAQRYIDHVRARRRFEPLNVEDGSTEYSSGGRLGAARGSPPDPDRPRYLALAGRALSRAVAGLDERDRLRLGLYYAQGLTLAEAGRLLAEHEATVSRHLSRTRRRLREEIDRELREMAGLSRVQIAECLACAAADPGPIDLADVFKPAGRGHPVTERS